MGIILCKKHGRQGFIEVCSHIDNEYRNEVYKEHREFLVGEIFSIDVCENCWEIYNLNRFNDFAEMSSSDVLDLDEDISSKIQEDWSYVYESVNRQPWCIQCIAEIQVKQARRNKETEPFPVFEKTLTARQKEVIEELEKNLTDNFEFQESIVLKTQLQVHPAIFVQAGAFTYPLTIEIYYISSENEQDRLIKFVEKFLQQTELNQAKIKFWESESWIGTENQFGLQNYHRGEEKLLREVCLNC